MDKLLEYDAFMPKTGEPTAQLVAWNGPRGGLSIEKLAFDQSASPTYDFLKSVQPEAGISYVLVNALGSYEFYDDNRNGDAFPARPYMVGRRALCGHPECTGTLDGWISEPETLLHHYKTFEQHGGIYKHHVNKDPTKSLGRINHAFWNPRMKRVELLLRVVNELDPQLAQRIGDGDFPAVSMGCHVRWDVCSICGHRAPTRAQYCEHARDMLRTILADGRRVCVHNPSPRFFDISFVFKPADETGWTLQKVAYEWARHSALFGETNALHDAVRAQFGKSAEELLAGWNTPYTLIGGFVRESAPAVVGREKIAGDTAEVAVAPARPLAQGEAASIFAADQGLKLSEHVIDRIVLATPALVALLGDHAETFKAASYGPTGDVFRDRAFSPWRDMPVAQVGPGAAYRAAEPPRTDMLTVTDPYTGSVYQTTRGAAMDASRSDVKSRLGNAAILSGLYAAGIHHFVGKKPSLLRTLALSPVAAGLGFGTERLLHHAFSPTRNPHYLTDQGVPVSGATEFKTASVTPEEWAEKLAYDLVERVGSADYGKLLRRVAYEAPHFAKWASLPLREQVRALTLDAEDDSDPAALPTLDLPAFRENVWRLLTT